MYEYVQQREVSFERRRVSRKYLKKGEEENKLIERLKLNARARWRNQKEERKWGRSFFEINHSDRY